MEWGNFLYSPAESEGIPKVSKVPAADFLIMPFGLTAQRAAALEILVKKHGVLLRRFPEAVLVELTRVSDHILRERASQDEPSQEIFDSITKFNQKASHWAMIALQTYPAARAPR